MHTAPQSLIALFDANPEHAHFGSPILAERARALAKALSEAKLCVVTRIGSPVIATVLDSLKERGGTTIVLSPASSRFEHEKAYRLPIVPSLIYTGKGAIGADAMAVASGEALTIIGSYPKTLENILEYVKNTTLPIGILTDEEPSAIYERAKSVHPRLSVQLFVSHDPATLVREIAEELRKKNIHSH